MDFLAPAQGDPDSEIEEKGLSGYNFSKTAGSLPITYPTMSVRLSGSIHFVRFKLVSEESIGFASTSAFGRIF
jgi:hypothetical protein